MPKGQNDDASKQAITDSAHRDSATDACWPQATEATEAVRIEQASRDEEGPASPRSATSDLLAIPDATAPNPDGTDPEQRTSTIIPAVAR